jgi:hypothetical protein
VNIAPVKLKCVVHFTGTDITSVKIFKSGSNPIKLLWRNLRRLIGLDPEAGVVQLDPR